MGSEGVQRSPKGSPTESNALPKISFSKLVGIPLDLSKSDWTNRGVRSDSSLSDRTSSESVWFLWTPVEESYYRTPSSAIQESIFYWKVRQYGKKGHTFFSDYVGVQWPKKSEGSLKEYGEQVSRSGDIWFCFTMELRSESVLLSIL